MSGSSFKSWVEAVFEHRSHPSAEDKAANLAYLTRLFEEPEAALEKFSDEQVAAGLSHLVHESNSNIGWALVDPALPWESRRRGLRAIESLFRRLFEKRCQKALSNKKEDPTPLNTVCYMWWDTFPTWGKPEKPEHKESDEELLGVMTRLLQSENPAVIESALHGLGHWHLAYPVKVEEIVKSFLKPLSDAKGVMRDLAWYALEAQRGTIQ